MNLIYEYMPFVIIGIIVFLAVVSLLLFFNLVIMILKKRNVIKIDDMEKK